MITRVFRVRIDSSKKREFEQDFTRVSVAVVQKQPGLISVHIGHPTHWTPNEYVMISRWKDEESLRAFVGESWNQAHVPDGMGQYVKECWVHHYLDI